MLFKLISVFGIIGVSSIAYAVGYIVGSARTERMSLEEAIALYDHGIDSPRISRIIEENSDE